MPSRDAIPRSSFPRKRESSDFAFHENWETRNFAAALSDEKPPHRGKLQARNYKPDGNFPVIDQGQSEIAGWTDDESLVIADGLPYVVFGDHTRAFKYVDTPFVLGADGTQLLKPSREYCPRFFYYACLQIDLPSRGYNRHFTFLKEKSLPLPPAPEQQKIAAVLWKLQRAIATQDHLLAATADLKQSAMQRLFTHGLKGEPLKDTEIGPVPESWTVAPIGSLFSVVQGLSLKGNLARETGGYLFLRTSNVYWGRIEVGSISRMHVEAAQLAGRELLYGDLLVCEGGEIGRAAVWHDELLNCTFQNHLHRLRPLKVKTVEPRFAMAWLDEGFRHRRVYEGAGNKTTIPNLSRARLSELSMPVPSFDEQHAIASALATIDKKLAHHRAKRAALHALFETLLRKLMTAEIRVADLEIDTSEVAIP